MAYMEALKKIESLEEMADMQHNLNLLRIVNDEETVCLLGKNVTRSRSHVNLGLDVEDYYRIKDFGEEFK